MTRIVINSFAGIAPRVSPRLLNTNQAQEARNIRLLSRALRSWLSSRLEDVPVKAGTLKTIHRYNEAGLTRWLAWTQEVDVVPAPSAGDTTGRIYFTGVDGLRVTNNTLIDIGTNDEYPEDSYLAGVPAPTTAPTPAVIGVSGGNDKYRAYVYTFVNSWGEESAPSPASTAVLVGDGQTVDMTTMDGAPAGDYVPITKWRIYRVNTGTAGSEYQFVAEVTINGASPQYNDAISDAALGEAVPTTDWDMPPANMVGVVSLPNGILAAILGNEILFSEPFVPYAWPVKYRLTSDHTPVGLGVYGNTLVVMTTGYPHLITGGDPASMSMEAIKGAPHCLSKRSIVSASRGVAYATSDGLYGIGFGGAGLITKDSYTRDEWLAIKPETMRAAFYDGRYTGFTDTGGVLIDIEGRDSGGIATFGFTPSAVTIDQQTGKLYYCESLGGVNQIREFNYGGSRLAYKWRSKQFQSASPITMTAARVLGAWGQLITGLELEALLAAIAAAQAARAAVWGGATTGVVNGCAINQAAINGDELPVVPTIPTNQNVVFRLYADGALVHEVAVESDKPFRLPSEYRALTFEIEMEGSADIYEIRVGTSMREIAQ